LRSGNRSDGTIRDVGHDSLLNVMRGKACQGPDKRQRFIGRAFS
jgi:hypothetical protein